jgi:uncharacterized metal-binding protein
MTKEHKKIVYSCSGCSSAAQMANWMALAMDREGIAEMSCVAGIGGDVEPLVAKALSASTIIGLDGCALGCVRACLGRHGLSSDFYFDLSKYGVIKKFHLDFDKKEAAKVYAQIREDLKK